MLLSTFWKWKHLDAGEEIIKIVLPPLSTGVDPERKVFPIGQDVSPLLKGALVFKKANRKSCKTFHW